MINILLAQRIFFASILVQSYVQFKIYLPSTYYVQNTVLEDEDNSCLEKVSVLCWQLGQKGRFSCYNCLKGELVPCLFILFMGLNPKETPTEPQENPKETPNVNVNENVNENDLKENTKRKVFTKPTVEEVKAYCDERKNNVNADKFIDFYESKGWLIGKNPMKDWKACVRTWEKGSTSPPNKPSSVYVNPAQKEFDDLSSFYAN